MKVFPLHPWIRPAVAIFGLALLCLTVLPEPAPVWASRLTILHTNDHHGHFAAFDSYPFTDIGGLAAQSTLVNRVRAEVESRGGGVLLLSAGDVNTGVPESDLLEARPDFELMNRLGYDAMVLGNHEFDNPLSVLKQQRQWADFPFLSANVQVTETGRPLFDPFVIIRVGDLRVGILGLTTAATPEMVPPAHIAGLIFLDPLAVAAERVSKLEERTDLMIALTHLGLEGPDYFSETAPHCDDRILAQRVQGIDVIVGGHSHTLLTTPLRVGQTLIVQAGEWSKYVGRLDLEITNGTIVSSSYALLPVNLKTRFQYQGRSFQLYQGQAYVKDPLLDKAVSEYQLEAGPHLLQSIGTSEVFLDGRTESVRSGETNLSRLITESMRAKTGADIALHNGGGIRDSIAPGRIRIRDLLRVLPFGNTLVLMELKGRDIRRILRQANRVRPGQGGYLHASGLSWSPRQGEPEEIRIKGRPLEPDRTYSVVTNSFLAAGGDGYHLFTTWPQNDTGYVDVAVLREFISGKHFHTKSLP